MRLELIRFYFVFNFTQNNKPSLRTKKKKKIQKNFNESAVRSSDGGKDKHHKDKKDRSAAKKLIKELSSCKTMLEEMEVCDAPNQCGNDEYSKKKTF